MGTTQKNLIMRTIGILFTAGMMGKNGGSFAPVPEYNTIASGIYKHGSSKINNKEPRKPKYSLVSTLCADRALFRDRSTGKVHNFAYKVL